MGTNSTYIQNDLEKAFRISSAEASKITKSLLAKIMTHAFKGFDPEEHLHETQVQKNEEDEPEVVLEFVWEVTIGGKTTDHTATFLVSNHFNVYLDEHDVSPAADPYFSYRQEERFDSFLNLVEETMTHEHEMYGGLFDSIEDLEDIQDV